MHCFHFHRKAKQYEKNVEELERAIEQAEGDNNQYGELAPGTQQVECEDIEEGTTDAEQYIYFNPDRPTDHTNYDIDYMLKKFSLFYIQTSD
jgi:hypothetical protein